MSIDDILDRELPRLEKLIESRKSGFLGALSQSKTALITLAALVFLFQVRDLPAKLANQSLDSAIEIQDKSPAKSVQLVTINNADYATLFSSTSPLNPKTLSKVLMAIAQAHPRAIIVDVDTSDSSFATMELPSTPTVWNMGGQEANGGKFLGQFPLGGSRVPAGSTIALAVVPNDERGIIRGYRRVYKLNNGALIASPAYAASRLLGSTSALPLEMPFANERFLDFRYGFKPASASNLLSASGYETWKSISAFRDKVIVVGGTFLAARDRYATPAGLLYGCEIVAQEAESEIDGTSIPRASRWLTGLLLVLGGLATVALYHWVNLRLAFLLSLLFIPILSIISNWILFHRLAAWGAMVPLVCAVIVAELYAKASLYLEFYKKVSALRSRQRSTAPIADESEPLRGPS